MKRKSYDKLFCEYVMGYYNPTTIKIYYSIDDRLFYSYWEDKYNAEFVSRAASKLNQVMKEKNITSLDEISIHFFKKDEYTHFEIKTHKKKEICDIKFALDIEGNIVYRGDNEFGKIEKTNMPLEMLELLDRISNYLDVNIRFITNTVKVADDI